ncbi:MAG: TadE/TadG family type IV pilus assembly protein [Kiloniellaceae bacterium]
MPIRRFLGDERGITSIEFVIVSTVFFMFILGIFDFSRALWEWNKASKATQAGVRFAVVSDMVSESWQTFNGVSITGVSAGDTVAVASFPLPNPTICTIAGCNGSAADLDPIAFAAIVDRMQRVFGRIAPANVVVRYDYTSLGFAGNPVGPDIDPLVTVSLVGMQFRFLSLGLVGLDTINMPDFAATLSGEDHCDLGPCV